MRRSRLEILRDILQYARKGATKTQIAYHTNLNYKLASRLLLGLLKAGYVGIEQQAKSRRRFITTPKGFDFLRDVNKMAGELSDLFIEKKQIPLMEEPLVQ